MQTLGALAPVEVGLTREVESVETTLEKRLLGDEVGAWSADVVVDGEGAADVGLVGETVTEEGSENVSVFDSLSTTGSLLRGHGVCLNGEKNTLAIGAWCAESEFVPSHREVRHGQSSST